MIRTPEGVLRGGVGGRAEAAGAERKEFSKMGRDFFFFFWRRTLSSTIGHLPPHGAPERRQDLPGAQLRGGSAGWDPQLWAYGDLSSLPRWPRNNRGPTRQGGSSSTDHWTERVYPSALPREDSKNPGQRRRAHIPEPHCPGFRSTCSFPSCVTQGRCLNLSVP